MFSGQRAAKLQGPSREPRNTRGSLIITPGVPLSGGGLFWYKTAPQGVPHTSLRAFLGLSARTAPPYTAVLFGHARSPSAAAAAVPSLDLDEKSD